MFPWLSFVTFPESGRRRRRIKHFLPTEGSSLCSVEVLDYIPNKDVEIRITSRANRSTPSPIPSTSSSKSPRPGSRSASARDKKPLFAPPPEPKPSRNQRKGLETSSAMLELFGGAQPLIQVSTSKPSDVEASTIEVKESIKSIAPQKSVEVENTIPTTEELSKVSGASACFENIVHPDMSQKWFGRSNVLERESMQSAEWEAVNTHPTTSSTFQTIEDHELKYSEAAHRSHWQNFSNHANHPSDDQDKLAQPGPEFFEDDEEEVCPAEKLLKSRQNIKCNLHDEDFGESEATVSEEFIPDEPSRKRRNGQNESNDHPMDPMQLSNPGPELADDEDEANKELVDGQKVAMDARVTEKSVEKEEKAAAAERAAADNNMQTPNAAESIEAVGIKAESMMKSEDDVFESATHITPSSPNSIQTAGPTGDSSSVNYNLTETGETSDTNAIGTGGAESGDMVSLTNNGNGTATKATGGGGGEKPILIKGAQIVNDDSIFAADILIEDGTIKQVSQSLSAPENAEVIEATGKLVLPAGIDVHTEFSTPGSVDDFSTGTRAALAGGTTTVIDVVLPRPEDTLISAFDRTRQQAEQRSVCNFGFSVAISKWSDAIKKEMELLVREKGVNSFILDLFSDSDLYAAFEHAKSLGAHVRILPENRELASLFEKKVLKAGVTGPEGYAQSRPSQLEADRIQHVSIISQFTNCPLSVLSVTSSEASRAIHHGRRDGALIQAEIPIAAIVGPSQNSSLLTKIPLRYGSQHTNDALEVLANGSLSMCVSDHCTPAPAAGTNFTRMSKGVAGVEERMMVLWEKTVTNGRIDPMRFVAVTSANAAKSFNLYPRKGRIAVGADADIVIWDIKSSKKLSSKTQQSKFEGSLFENISVRAFPTATICGGKLLFKDGKHVGAAPGMGAFLPLKPNSPFTFSVVQLRENMNNFSISAASASAPSHVQHHQPSVYKDDDRPITGSGRKNVQQEQPPSKPRTKVIHPPGGKSSGFW